MYKKIVSFFCVLGCSFSMVAQVFEFNGLSYKILNTENQKNVSVVGSSKQQSNVIEIPSEILVNNITYDVVKIGEDAFKFSTAIQKVIMPTSIREIGSGAFMNCINLKEINIPESVVKIGDFTFESCESLESIFIPSSVKQIGSFAFARCLNLNGIWLGQTVAVLGDEIFRDCIRLRTIRIPDSVTFIGEDAFYNCVNLASITVHYSKPIPISKFINNLDNITLKVPKGTALLFKNAPVWKEFGNIVEEMETAGLAMNF